MVSGRVWVRRVFGRERGFRKFFQRIDDGIAVRYWSLCRDIAVTAKLGRSGGKSEIRKFDFSSLSEVFEF